MILSAAPDQPTEVIGTAATLNGQRKEVVVEQPKDMLNPFGYVAPEPSEGPSVYGNDNISAFQTPPQNDTLETSSPQPLISQTSTTNPQEMSRNPLDYQDKIENTIYQDGDRLLDVQSIPIKDINEALTPNTQPTISNYPSF